MGECFNFTCSVCNVDDVFMKIKKKSAYIKLPVAMHPCKNSTTKCRYTLWQHLIIQQANRTPFFGTKDNYSC